MNSNNFSKIHRLAGIKSDSTNNQINRFKNFNYIFESFSFLNEISTEEYYKNFSNDIDKKDFEDIVNADPFSNKNKISHYAKWLLKLFKKGKLNLKELNDAKLYIQTFNDYKNTDFKGINIENYESLAELKKVINKKLDYTKNKSGEKIDLCKPIEGSKKIFENKKWCVIVPNTEYTSCYYGRNTEWCTAFGELSFDKKHKSKTNKFETYYQQNPFFILINKNNQSERYEFHFESNQYKDTDNKDIEILEFLENNQDIYDFFLKIKQKQMIILSIRSKELIDRLIEKLTISKILELNPNTIKYLIQNARNPEKIAKLIIDAKGDNLTYDDIHFLKNYIKDDKIKNKKFNLDFDF